MNHNLEGVYWDVGDNEYSLQVSFTAEQKQYVLNKFQDWKHVGAVSYTHLRAHET